MTKNLFIFLFDSERPNVTIINNVHDIRLLSMFNDDFLHDCQSLMYGIGIHYVQHFQAMLELGVCELELDHFFFHLLLNVLMNLCMQLTA